MQNLCWLSNPDPCQAGSVGSRRTQHGTLHPPQQDRAHGIESSRLWTLKTAAWPAMASAFGGLVGSRQGRAIDFTGAGCQCYRGGHFE
jgi:hypothetical protein